MYAGDVPIKLDSRYDIYTHISIYQTNKFHIGHFTFVVFISAGFSAMTGILRYHDRQEYLNRAVS